MSRCVTGGAGFIGSNLVRALLEHGDTVRVLDNFSTGNRDNLAEIAGEIEVIEGELRSYERVHNATRGSDVVFHIRALPSVPRSVQDPLTTSAVTIGGTLNVLLAARDEGVGRVVFASSSSVYGNSGTLPRVETAAADPIAPYAVAKPRPSATVSRLRPRDRRAAPLQRLRPRRPDLAVRRRTALHRERCRRACADLRRRAQSRDFTYVANVVEGNILA